VKRPRIGGAVYILPNLLTTGNLFFGFFSIMKSLSGEFAWAGSAIILAAIFDVLDGRVARLTKGTSEFGVQYDSLCDLVSFGCAPAILMYQYGLHTFGRVGWIACFLFMACGALRLARFNVQSSIGKASGDFTGLPIPMAALVAATFVLFLTDLASKLAAGETTWLVEMYSRYLGTPEAKANFLIVAGPALALAMVSNIVYRSHKVLKIRSIKPFRLLAGFVFVVALAAWQPETVGFAFAALYALSGPVEWALGWKKATEDDDIFAPADEGEDMEPGERANEGDDASDAALLRRIGAARSQEPPTKI
jgi:CDP-diacylglycerol--serine O-phosphatidyltransferase